MAIVCSKFIFIDLGSVRMIENSILCTKIHARTESTGCKFQEIPLTVHENTDRH